jgi:hypothetical protein
MAIEECPAIEVESSTPSPCAEGYAPQDRVFHPGWGGNKLLGEIPRA